MKTNVFILLLTALLVTAFAKAQRGTARIGYIDMDYILENVPEYQEASGRLDEKVNKWKSEIEKKLGDVQEMKDELTNEKALLTKELIEERDEEIKFEEDQILDYQQKRFGPGGDLAIQRRQLVQPVQDQVFNAVQEISAAKKFDLVFDKSSDLMMLYTADRLDISDQVLRSITRSAKRNQINNKKEEKSFDIDEAKTVEQDKATQERQKEIEAKKEERQAEVDARAEERNAQKAERNRLFEERRQRLLEERQRKKDSIAAVRTAKLAERNKSTQKTEGEASDPKARQAAILAARQRRKDSILDVRKRRRDSILAARKRKTNPPPATEGDDGGN